MTNEEIKKGLKIRTSSGPYTVISNIYDDTEE